MAINTTNIVGAVETIVTNVMKNRTATSQSTADFKTSMQTAQREDNNAVVSDRTSEKQSTTPESKNTDEASDVTKTDEASKNMEKGEGKNVQEEGSAKKPEVTDETGEEVPVIDLSMQVIAGDFSALFMMQDAQMGMKTTDDTVALLSAMQAMANQQPEGEAILADNLSSTATGEGVVGEQLITENVDAGTDSGDQNMSKGSEGEQLFTLMKDVRTANTNQTDAGQNIMATTDNLPVNVESGAVTVLDASGAREVLQQNIFDQIQTAVMTGKQEISLQLKPDTLGGLLIRLTMTEDGLKAQVRTSNQEVQQLVTAEIVQLEENLRARGIQVVEMDVIYDAPMNEHFMGHQFRGGQGGEEQGGFTSANAPENVEEVYTLSQDGLSLDPMFEDGVEFTA